MIYSSTLNLTICLYKLTTCVQILLEMVFVLLYMVYHSREIFKINLPTAHYGTNHVDRDTKSKAVMCMPVENKTKALITATRQFICNQGSFNYAFFSTSWAIIGHFATSVGWPLGPSNAECFVGEPQILVLNSSNCCKMISLNNDI